MRLRPALCNPQEVLHSQSLLGDDFESKLDLGEFRKHYLTQLSESTDAQRAWMQGAAPNPWGRERERGEGTP